MDNDKVILPRDVAEAIKNARAQGFENKNILYAVHTVGNDGDMDAKVIKEFAATNFDVLLSALINGFYFELTPEEKVREYYEGLMRAEDSQEIAGHSGSQFRQGWQSVRHTLELLGIKIEGINA